MQHRLQIGIRILLLPMAAGLALAQSHSPGKLPTIFRGPLSTRLASADTVAVSIFPSGVVPVYSTATTIQPGSWVSIYGSNLATGTFGWNGDFPTMLDGTSVTINNKPAYIYFVGPGQINVQAPDDSATGTVPVVVMNSLGTATSTVTLGAFGPSFFTQNGKYIAGQIANSDGTYDFLGPTGNSFGFPTKAATAGDNVLLYGVGFGPTNPPIASGQAVPSGTYGTATAPIQFLINGTVVTPFFSGITEAGEFQFNVTIPPGLGSGDVPIVGMVGGLQTPAGVFISLQ